MKSSILLLSFVLITLFTCLLLPEMLPAQPSMPTGDPAPSPIDGGLALLAVAGGGYAIKKLARRSLPDPRSFSEVDGEGELRDRKE